MSFTPSACQRDAIEAPPGPLLVLAGPGAGKTLCLIERIRFLIERLGFDPARICAVTFTNKAAEEIAERLQTLGDRARGVKRGTLHALCVEILREHGEWVGVRRGFGIADQEYQLGVLRRLGVWEKRRGWLLTRFGLHRAKDVSLTNDDLATFQRYCAHLQHRNLIDFDDIIVKTAELFSRYEEIAEQVAGRWDYLLVDEFQDLTPRQYAVVRRLAWRHRNLFGVGDDEQSVYSWTGADPRVLREFANDFGLTRTLVLDENRRTARHIFETARRLLRQNPSLFEEKVLIARRESPFPVRALGFPDEAAEAAWLLADLLADQAGTGLPWGEYAVLYRTHEIGELLEAQLIGAGIPCRLAAGRALQDDPVVRYLIAATRVIAEPDDALRQEEYVRVVLPPMLWAGIATEAERHRQIPLDWMRTIARPRGRSGRADEDTRKLRRADCALQNLPALAWRHATLRGLVEELLSQRVGEYKSVLEERHDELSDPALDPAVVRLAAGLERARDARQQVLVPRLGGMEIALAGMLARVGITATGPADRRTGDPMVLDAADGGGHGLAFGLFKALQLVSTSALRDTFPDFVAIDTETTDFDSAACEVIDLAAVRVRNGAIVDQFQSLIRPRRPIAPEAEQVHRISASDVRDAPALEEVWPGFRGFCGDDVLIAHNGNFFDFPILRRLGGDLPGGADFVGFDSLLLARQLHPGSRKLGDLAHHFGIPLPPEEAHRALADTRALALVFPRLQAEKLARARKTALAHLLDYLGLALVLSDPASLSEEARGLLPIARIFALGRYSDCLEDYRLAVLGYAAGEAPPLDEVIERLGGQRKLVEARREKPADQRYPVAMNRLRRLLDETEGASLAEQLRGFLDRIALSRSDAAEYDGEVPHRVNLLTLHSTKGLEFSRVYIVGAEDGQFIRIDRDGNGPPDSELQESRRLLYVGMTRAKDRLVLTRAERRKGMPTGGVRFLAEMGLKPEPAD
ncbi:MAG TPA: UvrD-helicase domain-containing protein [Gemmatimonadales bacterium]|nr:UvrD-helicase domain-containing protein [Gemmatimonadales bacterium]